jgi:hypothetical protein
MLHFFYFLNVDSVQNQILIWIYIYSTKFGLIMQLVQCVNKYTIYSTSIYVNAYSTICNNAYSTIYIVALKLNLMLYS